MTATIPIFRLLPAMLALAGFPLCWGQSVTPATDLGSAAQVVTLNGQVTVLKDAQPWALQVGSLVQSKQVIVTGTDGFAVLRVADGSTFEVYPNSQLTFRANPGNWRDLLDLWIGRVKVRIEHLSGVPNPNRVVTPTAVIAVRGTVFDVVVEDDEDTTLVAVEEGQVAVQHALLPRSAPKLINSGESIRVYKNQPLVAKSSIDRTTIIQRAMKAVSEAIYTIVYQGGLPRIPSGGGGVGIPGGSTESGDSNANKPPPEVAPTPPPPAPPK